MKMEYEDLLKLKIDIQTKNDTHFLELAMLLDKPEFLAYLPKVRKKYGFEKLHDLKAYFDRVLDEFDKTNLSTFDFSIYDNPKKLIDYANENAIWFDGIENEGLTLQQQLDTDSNILCYLFHRPPHFAESIKQAIVCGAVEGDMFHTTTAEVLENNMILSTTASFQLPQAVIVVTPTSTDLDILEEVGKVRKMYKTNKKLTYYKPRTDLVRRVRAYRHWYWEHLAGKSYKEISTDWTDRHANDSDSDYNRVYKGVAFYKNLLSQ